MVKNMPAPIRISKDSGNLPSKGIAEYQPKFVGKSQKKSEIGTINSKNEFIESKIAFRIKTSLEPVQSLAFSGFSSNFF